MRIFGNKNIYPSPRKLLLEICKVAYLSFACFKFNPWIWTWLHYVIAEVHKAQQEELKRLREKTILSGNYPPYGRRSSLWTTFQWTKLPQLHEHQLAEVAHNSSSNLIMSLCVVRLVKGTLLCILVMFIFSNSGLEAQPLKFMFYSFLDEWK